MFPWFDFLLLAILAWEAVSGYLFGVKTACIKGLTTVGAMLCALPFATKGSAYIQPTVERVLGPSLEKKVITVSTGQISHLYLGPWQSIIGVPASTDQYLESVLVLATKITSLTFFVSVFYFSIRIAIRPRKVQVPAKIGVLVGLGTGIIFVLNTLILVPVLVLGERGSVLTAAIEQSWLAQILGTPVQTLVDFIGSYLV